MHCIYELNVINAPGPRSGLLMHLQAGVGGRGRGAGACAVPIKATAGGITTLSLHPWLSHGYGPLPPAASVVLSRCGASLSHGCLPTCLCSCLHACAPAAFRSRFVACPEAATPLQPEPMDAVVIVEGLSDAAAVHKAVRAVVRRALGSGGPRGLEHGGWDWLGGNLRSVASCHSESVSMQVKAGCTMKNVVYDVAAAAAATGVRCQRRCLPACEGHCAPRPHQGKAHT